MQDLYGRARALLLSNGREVNLAPELGGQRFYYTKPSNTIYHYQWLWDSCFHALVMARYDAGLARAEIEGLLHHQRSDGFIPHVITWGPLEKSGWRGAFQRWLLAQSHFANFTQPPVLALAVEELYRQTGDVAFLRSSADKLKAHYRYFVEQRDPDADALVAIIAPIESGLDHSPTVDGLVGRGPATLAHHLAGVKLQLAYTALRWDLAKIFAADHFVLEDLAFNCMYAYSLRAVVRLLAAIDDPEAGYFAELADTVEAAILQKCYDPATGLFYSLATRHDTPVRVSTVASLLPLLLERLPADIAARLVEEHLLNRREYWTDYPVPSVALSEPTFRPNSVAIPSNAGRGSKLRSLYQRFRLVWRGPSWINTNWLLARGLRQHGYADLADTLTERTASMVERVGFWEYYHPYTGAGLGAGDFGWSTLVVDMLEDLGRRLGPATQTAPPMLVSPA